MEYVSFGNCGLKISRLCMGTMTFGGQADEAESIRMVDRSLDAGVNFFDTANVYTQTRSEQIVGKALAGKRDQVVVSTKVFGTTGPLPNDRGLSRRHILKAAEDSLERLGMDYVDIYLLHQPDYNTPLEESLAASDQLVREGKVRYVGLSNYASWQICHAMWISDRRNLAPVSVIQPRYSLLARDVEQELLPCCKKFGLGTMIYNPLAGGLLTGKHKLGQPPAKGTRFDTNQMYRDRFWHDRMLEAAGALQQAAEAAGLSIVELSLRWPLTRPGVTCVILGASSLMQLDANLKAADGDVPDELAAECDRIWEDLRGPAPTYNR